MVPCDGKPVQVRRNPLVDSREMKQLNVRRSHKSRPRMAQNGGVLGVLVHDDCNRLARSG
jgi:hypothetical protein